MIKNIDMLTPASRDDDKKKDKELFINNVRILISNYIPENDKYSACIMFQKEALALCMQEKAQVQAGYDFGYLPTSIISDILYGYDILIPEFIVQIRTNK